MNATSALVNAMLSQIGKWNVILNDSMEAEDAMSSYTGIYAFNPDEFWEEKEIEFAAMFLMSIDEAYTLTVRLVGPRIAQRWFHSLTDASIHYQMECAHKQFRGISARVLNSPAHPAK